MEERPFKKRNVLAIISLLLGIIAISPWIFGAVIGFIGGAMRGTGADPSVVIRLLNTLFIIFIMFITPLTAIGGVICGVFGWGSERKKTALFGFLVSILAFILFGLGVFVY